MSTITLPVFTCANPLCLIFYTLTLSTGLAIPAAFMSFDASTRKLQIYSASDNSIAGAYSLKYVGAVPGGLTNFETITVTINHQCTLSTLTAIPIIDISYDVAQTPLL